MTELDTESFLERLWRIRSTPSKKSVYIREDEIRSLCTQAEKSFLDQPSLLEIEGPIKICGDIHGQYFDLLKLFDKGGKPPLNRYLFLGDYVDRGKNSVETICLLLALKVTYPKSFYLVRGNHESSHMNDSYGFLAEIKRRFINRNYRLLFERINKTFDHIPLAAVVSQKIFCCHGGLGPGLTRLDQIRRLKRPMPDPKDGWASDLMWSDPDDEIDWWEKQDQPLTNPKHRGKGYLFGQLAAEEFLRTNNLQMICRAHECISRGYRWYFDKKLLTVFSAPNYCDQNPGAMLKVSKSGEPTGFHLFR